MTLKGLLDIYEKYRRALRKEASSNKHEVSFKLLS